MKLFNPTNATLGSLTNAVLTIIDDESSNIPAGALDTSYNPSAGTDGFINALVVQPDGKLLLGGDFITVNGLTRRAHCAIERKTARWMAPSTSAQEPTAPCGRWHCKAMAGFCWAACSA